MDEQLFQFESDRGFVMSGQGVVFVGRVREGQVSVGDRVQVDEKGGQFIGMIRAIEHEKRLIDQTIVGAEIGMLLSDFSDTELGKILYRVSQEGGDPDSIDMQAEFAERGIMFPVVLSLAPNGRHIGLWESIRKLMGMK
jgi:selenocysteine-specific translation elongation factor